MQTWEVERAEGARGPMMNKVPAACARTDRARVGTSHLHYLPPEGDQAKRGLVGVMFRRIA
jgi:hypothetical protein